MWTNAEPVIEAVDTYHGRDAESASRLKTYVNSPRQYYRENILKIGRKATPAMEMGTAIHEELLLESWLHSYIEIPKSVLSSSGSKAGNAWQEFKAANVGRVLLKTAEIDSLLTVMAAIGEHELAASLLEPIEGDFSEITITANAPVLITTEDGVESSTIDVRSRLDFLSPKRRKIVDLKTTGDMSDRAMRYKAIDSGWPIQAQFYRKMCHALFGDWFDVDFVVAETKEPYRVEVWSPSQETLAQADRCIEEALQEISASRREYAITRNANVWQKRGYAERNIF